MQKQITTILLLVGLTLTLLRLATALQPPWDGVTLTITPDSADTTLNLGSTRELTILVTKDSLPWPNRQVFLLSSARFATLHPNIGLTDNDGQFKTTLRINKDSSLGTFHITATVAGSNEWTGLSITVDIGAWQAITFGPPSKKILETVRSFTNDRGLSAWREVWSRTLEFPGPVIWIQGRWWSSNPDRTYMDKATVRGKKVTVYGKQLHENFYFFPFVHILDGTVTVRFLPDLTSPAVDVNSDDVVNIQDLVFVASQFGPSGEVSLDIEARTFMWESNDADVNWDGTINIQDLVLVAAGIGKNAAAPSIQAESLAMLSSTEVKQWLEQAQHLTLSDAISQRGIAVLEQLLSALTPEESTLLPNYPNPFNPETWIPYHLAVPSEVTLTIYTANGKLVRTLVLGHQAAGIYESKSRAAYWDGRNAVGERVASGVYFYMLTADDFTATGKMLIMK